MNLGGESGVPTMEILANILQIESDESELNNSVTKSKKVLEDSDIIKVIDMESSTLEEISNENGELEETKKKTKSFNKMSIKELQEYVVLKGINQNSDITKFKKADLLELINKENNN